jgi:hypothetical protein
MDSPSELTDFARAAHLYTSAACLPINAQINVGI